MASKDPRIDAYIAKSADFAQPILNHLRRLVHTACPEVEETFKWSFPHFIYKGMLCHMAAFRAHCAFGFWKRTLIFGNDESGKANGDAMGQFGRITSLSDLPKDKVLLGYIKEAVRLNEAGIKAPPGAASKPRKDLVVPDYFMAALKRKKKALTAFENFSPSHKREYVEWITEAKREETRAKRLETAVAWMSIGKPRHWKYANC
ncbi:MAG TPA: YdeI/OmpD-associated family protein [Candidatus Binatia bacterium]|jgi:uncharacterized protein YdeI (YjbR/CyaY-like superfamily)|nr:YdeI/OmpD-associated family protein [Candidatus Binatia bacterium]